jgi:hypothetical protein
MKPSVQTPVPPKKSDRGKEREEIEKGRERREIQNRTKCSCRYNGPISLGDWPGLCNGEMS